MKKAPFLALVAVIVLLIGMWPPWPAGSQTTGITSQTQVVNSTAAAGTSSVIALDGKYSNCTVIAQTSTSTASVVVYGNTQATQYGPAAPNAVNSNFGSSGTITATTTQSQTSGNVANLPVGFYFTWSGNSGTLYAWAVCSSAIARAAAGATGAPGPTGPTGPPGPTGSPGAVPTFTASAPLAVSTGSNTVTYTCATCSTGGAVPSFSASPPIVVATPAGQVNVSCPSCAASGTAYGGVQYAAGVPTAVSSQVGQLDVATDTLWADMKTFSYVGSETGLPVIVNRCILYNTAASGNPSIPCERTITSGDLLITELLGFNGGFVGATTHAGWTQLFLNAGGEVGLLANWQVAGSNASPAPVTITGADFQQILVVEIANAGATPSPSATNDVGNPAFTSVTSVATNTLILGMSGCEQQQAMSWAQYVTNGGFTITGTNNTGGSGALRALSFGHTLSFPLTLTRRPATPWIPVATAEPR